MRSEPEAACPSETPAAARTATTRRGRVIATVAAVWLAVEGAQWLFSGRILGWLADELVRATHIFTTALERGTVQHLSGKTIIGCLVLLALVRLLDKTSLAGTFRALGLTRGWREFVPFALFVLAVPVATAFLWKVGPDEFPPSTSWAAWLASMVWVGLDQSLYRGFVYDRLVARAGMSAVLAALMATGAAVIAGIVASALSPFPSIGFSLWFVALGLLSCLVYTLTSGNTQACIAFQLVWLQVRSVIRRPEAALLGLEIVLAAAAVGAFLWFLLRRKSPGANGADGNGRLGR